MKNGSLKDALDSAVTSTLSQWRKAKRHAGREGRIRQRDLERLRLRWRRKTVKEAAFQVMEEAYLKASAGGRYPANARQIYYAARPTILSLTGWDSLDSRYFTQTLLKDYIEEFHPDWDVVYDDRGHLSEPHTGRVIGLGGLAVRGYIRDFTDSSVDQAPAWEPQVMLATTGPRLRYGQVLFLEVDLGLRPESGSN